jgi:cAMP-dependent protein kinase regulator
MYESFLATVDILSSLKPSERAKIADVLESRTFNHGDAVIHEGDDGDEFFLVESGTAEAFKSTNGKEVAVKTYSVGDYFGGD